MPTVVANRNKPARTVGTSPQADESMTDDRAPDVHLTGTRPGRGAAGRVKAGPGLVAVSLVLGALAAATGVFLAPRVPSLSTQITGDPALAVQARAYLDGALDV